MPAEQRPPAAGEDERSLILIRLSGDIGTKSRQTRLRFTRRLARNIEDALHSADLPYELERQWSRLYVHTREREALSILPRIFGVQSLSPAERHTWVDLDDIVRRGAEIFRPAIQDKTFAVRARRGGERARTGFSSNDIEIALGSALLPHAARVDLDAPEVTVQVELNQGLAYYFSRQIAGPGGLPLGVEGRALALVSGGFDSAVASWLMLKRGVRLDYLFFNLGGAVHEQGVLRVMKVIADNWSYGYRPRLYAVDLRPLVAELKESVLPRYWQVILKRLMLRGADRLAEQLRSPALVTGEAVGQVSSQTLQNLAVVSRATELPILRPLVGLNKEEIICHAKRIGTYELSAAVAEYCALMPRHPSTRASIEAVVRQESELELRHLEDAVDRRTAHNLRQLAPAELSLPDLEIEEIPQGAVLIDLRSRTAFDAWHYPDAVRLDYFAALKDYTRFDPSRIYVFYCEVALKSAHLAETMRAHGYRAYHIKGGLKRLMALAVEKRLTSSALLSPALLND